MKFRNKSRFLKQINKIGIRQFCNPIIPIPIEYLSKWSYSVRARDGKRCQICGTKKLVIAHHILYRINYPKLILVKNNGIALCNRCEDQAHGRELQLFIPQHIKVPSLKQMLRNVPLRVSILRWLKKKSSFLALVLSICRY